MSIRIDEHWHYEGHPVSREKRVYRDALLIGRVRRWQVTEPGGPTRERFTVECRRNMAIHPVGEPEADFEGALEAFLSAMPG